MAEGSAVEPSRGIRTICLAVCEEEYQEIVDDPSRFRRLLDSCYQGRPELFPEGFSQGYELKDGRVSEKAVLRIRRIERRDGRAYSIRPSFVMPYMTGRTKRSKARCFFASLAFLIGAWPTSSVATPCTGIVWSARRAATVLWEPPCAKPNCPSTCWPTSTVNRVTERRTTSPRRSAAVVAWDSGSSQAPPAVVHGDLAAGVGCLSCPRSPEFLATHRLLEGVGREAPQRRRPGERLGPLREA